MLSFFIDSCHKKLRILTAFVCLLFVIIGSFLEIAWYIRFGAFFLVIFLIRINTRYCFFPDRIEKRRCRTTYETSDLFPDRNTGYRFIDGNPVRVKPQRMPGPDSSETDPGRLVKSFLRSELQNIQIFEGMFYITVLLQFSGSKPRTERFLWMYCFHNRKTMICIRSDIRHPDADDFIRSLETYAHTKNTVCK